MLSSREARDLRVLVNVSVEGEAEALAKRLAGSGGDVVYLSHVGVRSLNRQLSPAEVDAIRRALAGRHRGGAVSPRPQSKQVVGYVCRGRLLTAQFGSAKRDVPMGGAGPRLIAVSDHADLTFCSPLRGPNPEVLGPRFPLTAGLYEPSLVLAACPEAEAGEVTEVHSLDRLTDFESLVVSDLPFAAATNQLASLAILAAHLSYKLAALVVCE